MTDAEKIAALTAHNDVLMDMLSRATNVAGTAEGLRHAVSRVFYDYGKPGTVTICVDGEEDYVCGTRGPRND